jgi:hypothetical protein
MKDDDDQRQDINYLKTCIEPSTAQRSIFFAGIGLLKAQYPGMHANVHAA